MTVLRFIPNSRKRVHSICAIWRNSTQIILLHWKEILFSSRHLWPSSLDRLTSVRSAKAGGKNNCSTLHRPVWIHSLSSRNPFIQIYQSPLLLHWMNSSLGSYVLIRKLTFSGMSYSGWPYLSRFNSSANGCLPGFYERDPIHWPHNLGGLCCIACASCEITTNTHRHCTE